MKTLYISDLDGTLLGNVTKQPIITNFFDDKDVWPMVRILLENSGV